MATIDNLSIEISANADRALRAIDRLASGAGRLRNTAQSAGGGMQDMARGAEDAGTATATAGTAAGQAQRQFRGVGNAAKDAGDKAKKGASGVAKFWNALKRIVFYRAVRSVIREIADAFKTGITNLYQWSSAINGTFAKSMDRIATSTLYLKNSLGAMLAPLINTLAPVIEWIIDRIVDVINWINKLFAALSGSQTYTVAKKVATKWGDAGKTAAGSAKKAADDIKRTILGFDEINKLSKENTSSYGGGSGSASSGPNYNDMFEERKLDGWMSRLAAFIDKFNLQIPAVFGALLAGWAAVSLAIKGVAALTSGWLGGLAGSVISIGVTLFRKGWSTLLNWVTSFGAATVPVAVTIGVTALALWLAFKVDWAAVRDKVLDIGVRIATSASELWLNLQLGWSTLREKVLNVGVQIVTRAAELWLGLQLGWALLRNRALNVSAKIATSAAELWLGLQLAWSTLTNKALNVAAKIATTASDLWLGVQLAWSKLGEKALSVKAIIITTAAELWGDLKERWANLNDKVLEVAVKAATPAVDVWNELKVAWSTVVGARNKVLEVGAKIATTSSSLWKQLNSAWTTHENKSLGVNVNVETPVKDLWEGLKKNWKTVAAVGLGFGVAIATPWGTIASELAGLWSEVTSGGALAFGIAPVLGDPTTQSNIGRQAAVLSGKGGSYYDNSTGILHLEADPVDAVINASPGEGFEGMSGAGRFSLIEPEPIDVDANLNPGWWGSAVEALGLDGLQTGIEAKLTKGWDGYAIDYMHLNNLSTTVRVGLGVDRSRSSVSLSTGGGGTWRLMTQALGGIFSGGVWSSIPQFANGTLNAGSIFAAGERGPELVGHIGGRTEVLNRSQIASAIYSAVQAAMAPASANFAQAAAYMNNRTDDGMIEAMAEMVKAGVEQAMERERDILRQQLETLRQINDKDFSANISTSDINKAQTRANRRAGTTIVPVG